MLPFSVTFQLFVAQSFERVKIAFIDSLLDVSHDAEEGPGDVLRESPMPGCVEPAKLVIDELETHLQQYTGVPGFRE
jgi:hypothetical protein